MLQLTSDLQHSGTPNTYYQLLNEVNWGCKGKGGYAES